MLISSLDHFLGLIVEGALVRQDEKPRVLYGFFDGDGAERRRGGRQDRRRWGGWRSLSLFFGRAGLFSRATYQEEDSDESYEGWSHPLIVA